MRISDWVSDVCSSDLRIDTGHGVIAVEIFEDGVPPRWRVRSEYAHAWAAEDIALVTERPDGARQVFTFADRGGFLESLDDIPQPHEFMVRVSLGHGSHAHDYDLSFIEEHAKDHEDRKSTRLKSSH